MGFLLPSAQLTAFLKLLMRDSTLIAPLKRKADDVVVFEELHAEQELRRLELAAIPQFSAKRFFMPAYEELFEYDIKDQELTDRKLQPRPRILFGLHLCDLNAIKIQDALFMGKQYVDDHYKNSRDHVYLVGWYCNTPPSTFCFCESMKLTNYYDLMLRELPGKLIHVDVGTPKGMLLMEKARALNLKEHHEQIPQIRTEKHLNTHDIRGYFDHPKWKEVTEELCLSCQRCTTMCPTCMCFGIYDETRPDLRHGVRKRSWDSCHSKEFTRVAGDHIFRPDRTARFKHRVYHKITYYPEVFGTPMCTGCGRCIEQCPTEIDFVKIINDMQK